MANLGLISILGVDAPVMTNWIGSLLLGLYDSVGTFGWTVVVFAIILKLIMSPLDIWQRLSMRKQQLKTEALRPKLEKLERQYANRPDLLKQKQMELQKGTAFTALASCLPMIISMVVFFVVFAGFRSLVTYQNQYIVYELNNLYIENIGKVTSGSMTMETLNSMLAEAYKPESWLWVKNVFMSDIGTNVIPSATNFVSSGFGGINSTLPEGMATDYTTLVGPAMELYNKKSFWDAKHWNGYFVLPILSIATSFASSFMMQKLQPQSMGTKEQQQSQQKTMKIMNMIMPIFLGVFAILYSAAFAIYYLMSNILSVAFTLSFTAITKAIDKKKLVQPV